MISCVIPSGPGDFDRIFEEHAYSNSVLVSFGHSHFLLGV